jgi:tetratricopeptide (TPR) repeat protein
MRASLLPTALIPVLLLLGFLPQSNSPARQDQQTGEVEELKEALRLKEAVVALYKQGKYDDALPLAKRALDIEQRLFGPAHERVAVALKNLAEIYLAKKKDDEVEKLFRQALVIFKRDEDRNTDSIGSIFESLALVRFEKKNYAEAATLLESLLTLRRKTFGSEDIRTADTLLGLANVFHALGQYEKVEPLYLEGLTIKEKVLGPSNPNTVEAMRNFACSKLLGSESKISILKQAIAVTRE